MDKIVASESNQIKESNGDIHPSQKGVVPYRMPKNKSPILNAILKSKIFNSNKNIGSRIDDLFSIGKHSILIEGLSCDLKDFRLFCKIVENLHRSGDAYLVIPEKEFLTDFANIPVSHFSQKKKDVVRRRVKRLRKIEVTVSRKHVDENNQEKEEFYNFNLITGAGFDAEKGSYCIDFHQGFFDYYSLSFASFLDFKLFDSIKTVTAQALHNFYLCVTTPKRPVYTVKKSDLKDRLGLEHLSEKDLNSRLKKAHSELVKAGVISYDEKKDCIKKKGVPFSYKIRFIAHRKPTGKS